MRLQTKTVSGTCMAVSFAMALGIPQEEMFKLLGHDGSKVAFQRPEPMCYIGHHIDECVWVALQLGMTATPIELFPATASSPVLGMPNYEVPILYDGLEGNWRRFDSLVNTRSGVIEGNTARAGHAVAFQQGRIFDPNGREYAYSREVCEDHGFYSRKLWLIENAP